MGDLPACMSLYHVHKSPRDWRVKSALRAYVALSEDLDSIPRTHGVKSDFLF